MAEAIANRTACSEIALYAVPSSDVRGRRVVERALPRRESADEASQEAVRPIELRDAALPSPLPRSGIDVCFESTGLADSRASQWSA